MIIRDPVHGDVELTDEERSVLDSGVMQRLRAIKQLGAAYLVYPGCTHTRFEHSLGTLAAASRVLDALRAKAHPVSVDERRLIRMAALVHDVTHIPFGHTFEDERKVFPRHDTPSRVRRFLVDGALGEILNRLGLAEEIFALITRPADWRGEIVAGTLDADLLDYLRRDSYFAGLSHDYDDRIYRYFCVEEGHLAVDLTKRGLERYDARSEIVHLLRLRYFLTERVYFHHAKVIAGAMISKALELATEMGVGEEDLYAKGDESLLTLLEETASRACDAGKAREAGRAVLRLVRGVRERHLLKRAFALSHEKTPVGVRDDLVNRFHHSRKNRMELEGRIAARACVPPHSVIVYCPAHSALKEARVLARLPEGVRQLSGGDRGRQLELDALEEQYARIWRFWVFCPPGDEARVGAAAAEALDRPNELRTGT